jgi:peptidoglycan/LPS O-acetylase OafA/YrhL
LARPGLILYKGRNRVIPRLPQTEDTAPNELTAPVVSAVDETRAATNFSFPVKTSGSIPASSDGKKPERFSQLDGLRGAAAIGVVLIHYMEPTAAHLPTLGWAFNFLAVTPLSLDVFFVLSGFLIGGILLRSKDRPGYYGNFYKRRFARIMPVYYAWLALFVVLYLTCQGWGLTPPQSHSGTFYLLSFAFMFQNFFPSVVESSFVMAPTWTLAVEEHFYLLAPLAVRRFTRRRLAQVLVGIIAIAPIFRGVLESYIGHHAGWANSAARIWTPCRADALAMGVLLALAWDNERSRSWLKKHVGIFLWSIAVCTSYAALLLWSHFSNPHHWHFMDVAFERTAVEISGLGLIVYLICQPESWLGRFLSSKTMRYFGRISYCLYIVHWGVNWMLFRFVLHARFGERLWLDVAMVPVSLLLSVGLAQLSATYFEGPILRRRAKQDRERALLFIGNEPAQAA